MGHAAKAMPTTSQGNQPMPQESNISQIAQSQSEQHPIISPIPSHPSQIASEKSPQFMQHYYQSQSEQMPGISPIGY
jgi:hypothetical protein